MCVTKVSVLLDQLDPRATREAARISILVRKGATTMLGCVGVRIRVRIGTVIPGRVWKGYPDASWGSG